MVPRQSFQSKKLSVLPQVFMTPCDQDLSGGGWKWPLPLGCATDSHPSMTTPHSSRSVDPPLSLAPPGVSPNSVIPSSLPYTFDHYPILWTLSCSILRAGAVDNSMSDPWSGSSPAYSPWFAMIHVCQLVVGVMAE